MNLVTSGPLQANSLALIALPEFVNSSIEAGFEGRIANSAGLIGVGTALVMKSGVCWKGAKPAVQQINLEKQTLRRGATTVGLVAICYSIYIIYLEVIGFSQMSASGMPHPFAPEMNAAANPKVAVDGANVPIPRCDQPHLWPEYQTKIADALNQCSATRRIGDQANQISLANRRPPWHIKIVSRESQMFDGAAAYLLGEVRIRCDAEKPVSIAAFELTNMEHQNSFYALWKKALAGEVSSRDEYAKMIEKIEFDGTQIHIGAMDTCMQELGWKDVQIWSKNTWESWWPYTSTTSHAEEYRKDWDSAMQYLRGAEDEYIDGFIFLAIVVVFRLMELNRVN